MCTSLLTLTRSFTQVLCVNDVADGKPVVEMSVAEKVAAAVKWRKQGDDLCIADPGNYRDAVVAYVYNHTDYCVL